MPPTASSRASRRGLRSLWTALSARLRDCGLGGLRHWCPAKLALALRRLAWTQGWAAQWQVALAILDRVASLWVRAVRRGLRPLWTALSARLRDRGLGGPRH